MQAAGPQSGDGTAALQEAQVEGVAALRINHGADAACPSTLNLQLPTTLSEAIQRTLHPAAALPQNVGVDHGGGDIIMAEQLLNRAYVRPPL